MKKYYYVCPRCGRRWTRFIPRSKMKCPFCSEEWRTRGRRGTRSRFSWTATALWLFWIAVVALIVCKGRDFVDRFSEKVENRGVVQQTEKDVKIPPIRFRTQEELQKETERLENDSDASESRPPEETEENPGRATNAHETGVQD